MLQFMKVQLKKNYVLIVTLVLGPAFLTALFCALIISSKGEQQFQPYKLHEIQKFPSQLTKFPIAFSPINVVTIQMMENIQKELGFSEVKQFLDEATMNNYFVEANLREDVDAKLQQFGKFVQENQAVLPFALDQSSFTTFLTTDYKHNYLSLPDSIPLQKQEKILFGINFDHSADHMNYTVYFNQQLLQEYQYSHVDTFSRHFTAANEPTFSPYGFFIQSAIENQLLPAPITHRLGSISRKDSQASTQYTIYQLACILPSITPGVLFQIISAQIRSEFIRLPKRLGASEIQYSVVIFIFGFLLISVSVFLQMLASFIFNVEPYNSFSVDVWIVFSILISITQTCYCMLVSAFIQNLTGQVIIQLLVSFMVCSQSMILSTTSKYGYKSMFDRQSLATVLWAAFCILPPLTVFGISDWWAGLKFLQFKEKSHNHLSSLSAIKNMHVPAMDQSYLFKYPDYSSLCAAVCVQAVVILIIVMYLNKILNQPNQLGLPFYYLFDKKYYKQKKDFRQQDSEIRIRQIQINKVAKNYRNGQKRKEVLKNINFSAQTGQIVGLMGLSGCGKTTFCKIIQNEIKAEKGSNILFENIDLLDKYQSLNMNIVASCPQDKSNIMQNASIQDNILVCKQYLNWTEKSIDLESYIQSLLTILKLEKHQNKRYDELSGGMQRRVSLLIALIQTPQILVLDEITANVDPQLKHDIWNVLNDYQNKFNRIIIITSHDSFELQYICSHIIHIREGIVVNNGSVLQMLQNKPIKDHTLSINELFNETQNNQDQIVQYPQVQSILSASSLNTDSDQEQPNYVSNLKNTTVETQQNIEQQQKKHNIENRNNYLGFAFRIRWFRLLNNKFGTIITLILLNILFALVYYFLSAPKSQVDKTDPSTLLHQIIQKYSINTQVDFHQALLSQTTNRVQISTQSPTSISMQTLKNAIHQDQLSQFQVSLGDYSMFVGQTQMPHQYINYLIQQDQNIDPSDQFTDIFKTTVCTSLDYHISNSIHSGCDAPVTQGFVPRIAEIGGIKYNLPIYVNFSTLKKARNYISSHAPEKQYDFNFVDQSANFQASRITPYPLSIIHHVGDTVDIYIHTPSVSSSVETFKDISLSKMYYSLSNWTDLSSATLDQNVSSIINYQNDFLTKYHSMLIKQHNPSWKYLSANFIQQPQYKTVQSKHYITKINAGQMKFGFFYALVLCLLILSTTSSFYYDSAKILRNQLEGIGQLQVKQILSQVVTNILQILVSTIIFFAVFCIFRSTPHDQNWQIYLNFILEAVSHAMLLQVYLLIFEKLQTLVLVICLIFVLSFFLVAYVHLGKQQSLVLTLVLPGFYFFYISNQLSFLYQYPVYEWIYPLLLNFAELLIALYLIYRKGRKNKASNTNQDIMIHAANVSAGYKNTKILQNMNLQLKLGESISLIGNNGCGKTTFIKCVLNQLKHSGTLEHTNDISIIPQDDIEFQDITVKQYFQILGTFDKQLLTELGLHECMTYTYKQLSGGQRRRLTIALVLSLQPTVLVLDEVTAGSDFIMKKAIWDNINRLSDTKIIITHDMEEVKMNGNLICVLKKGSSFMLTDTHVGWMVVVYENIPKISGFVKFFDKYVIKVDSQEQLQKVIEQLETDKTIFTVEENGLEVVFLE
ncbi:ABC_transporter family protein [Hexamita inflata]|uniref:ABC transporter family protein n=1 Tax=Hexamita inflata TaxID=28002 RepID=A0AA86TJ63_9EUKA|nr:ABC transporter family protein [Hexamita inflata]